MIEIRVVNFCGSPVVAIAPILLGFSREISVGRSAECDLVLPDADRHISRVQARIACDSAGALSISNCSTVNSIFIDTAEVQPFERRAVEITATIMIGLYELALRMAAQSTNLTELHPESLETRAGVEAGLASEKANDDWSHLLDGIQNTNHGQLMASPLAGANRAEPISAAWIAPKSAHVPQWDEPMKVPATFVPSIYQDPLQLGTKGEQADLLASMFENSVSLDAVMGAESLSSSKSHSMLLPLAGILEDTVVGEASGTLDLVALFGGDEQPLPNAHGFEGKTHIVASDIESVFDLPKTLLPAEELLFAFSPTIALVAPMPHEPLVNQHEKSPPEVAQKPESTSPPPSQALLEAFFEGVGWSQTVPNISLNVEYMRSLGQLLRNGVEGAHDLALIQKEIKREIGGQASANAPFSANIFFTVGDIQSVLQHMVLKPYPGLVDPHRATKDVFDEFKKHEMAMLAAVRATLIELMDLLNPGNIAQPSAHRNFLDAVTPGKEKARLWDSYVSTFASTFGGDTEATWSFLAANFRRHYEHEAGNLAAGETTD